jgi:hypothetical protein
MSGLWPSAHAPLSSKFLEVRWTSVPQPHWQLNANLVSALFGSLSASRRSCSFRSVLSSDPTHLPWVGSRFRSTPRRSRRHPSIRAGATGRSNDAPSEAAPAGCWIMAPLWHGFA